MPMMQARDRAGKMHRPPHASSFYRFDYANFGRRDNRRAAAAAADDGRSFSLWHNGSYRPAGDSAAAAAGGGCHWMGATLRDVIL